MLNLNLNRSEDKFYRSFMLEFANVYIITNVRATKI